jgi:DNA-binding FadR family transcriptional regulator
VHNTCPQARRCETTTNEQEETIAVTWWLGFHLHPIDVYALLATRPILEESVMQNLAAGATASLRTMCAPRNQGRKPVLPSTVYC